MDTRCSTLRVKVLYLSHKEGQFFWQNPGSRVEVVFQRKQILHCSHGPTQGNFPNCLHHAWDENKVTKTPHWSLILTVCVSFQSIVSHPAGKALWPFLSINLNIFWDLKSDTIIVAFPCLFPIVCVTVSYGKKLILKIQLRIKDRKL